MRMLIHIKSRRRLRRPEFAILRNVAGIRNLQLWLISNPEDDTVDMGLKHFLSFRRDIDLVVVLNNKIADWATGISACMR